MNPARAGISRECAPVLLRTGPDRRRVRLALTPLRRFVALGRRHGELALTPLRRLLHLAGATESSRCR
jgi:hypothetical protein